jgi:hypothetical protein
LSNRKTTAKQNAVSKIKFQSQAATSFINCHAENRLEIKVNCPIAKRLQNKMQFQKYSSKVKL